MLHHRLRQVRVHIDRLVELEYVYAHRGRGGQSFVYELCYDGEGTDGSRFVLGLIDADAHPTTPDLQAPAPDLQGPTDHLQVPNRPRTGAKQGSSRPRTPHESPMKQAEDMRSPIRTPRTQPPILPNGVHQAG